MSSSNVPSSSFGLSTAEETKGYNAKDLNVFLKKRLNDIDDKYIDILTTQEVDGSTFLAIKYETLVGHPLNILAGPALKLAALVQEIRREQPVAGLTEKELLQTVLSVPKMHSIKTKSTVKAATRKVPNDPVLAWDDFLTNAFNASASSDTYNHIYSRPNITGALPVEDSVVDMFLRMTEATSNKRLIHLAVPERWGKRYMFRAIKGQPDAIRCGAKSIKLLNDSEASLILSAVEVKPEQLMRTLVDDKTELFNAYNTALTVEDDGTNAYTQHEKIIRIVRQLFGYMVVNDLKYGLLTTYIRTWFFCRQDDNPDNIYISPAVHIDQGHTANSASFLECMYYFELISTLAPTGHSSPPDTEGDDDDKDKDDKDKDDKDKDKDKDDKDKDKDKDDKDKDDKDKDDKDKDEGDKNKDKDSKDRSRDRDKDDEYRPSSSKNLFKRTFKVITRSKGKEKQTEEFLNSMKNFKRSQFSFGDVLGNGRSGTIFMAKLHEQVGALKMVDQSFLNMGFSMRHLLLYLHHLQESHLQIIKISQKKKSSWPLMVY